MQHVVHGAQRIRFAQHVRALDGGRPRGRGVRGEHALLLHQVAQHADAVQVPRLRGGGAL